MFCIKCAFKQASIVGGINVTKINPKWHCKIQWKGHHLLSLTLQWFYCICCKFNVYIIFIDSCIWKQYVGQ